MASQSLTGVSKKFRHRLRAITLDPATSSYDVAITLLVDDKKVHKLRRVQKGQTLRWDDLPLPCDVHENSTLTVQVDEIHKTRDRTELHKYQIPRVLGHDSWSIGRGNGKYAVEVEFLNSEMAERAYREAFAKVQQLESQVNVPGKTGKARAAFKALLMLGSTMTKLDPSGGTRMAFVVCAKAWELVEEQDKQNEDIHKLVEDLGRMIPPIESVKRLANANLGQTVMGMLNLIEDVSLFIVRFYSRSYRTKLFSFSIFDSGPPDPTQEFIEKFKSLKEEFETRMAAQTLEAVQALDTLQTLETARATDITEILNIAQADMIRSRLKPVDQAGYDPTRTCMPGTRAAIINDIVVWVRESDRRRQLAWVYGLAGLGKSSIATSVCEQLDERGMLATSFFCKRDNPGLRDPHRVLTSIAYRLALRWKPYGEAVAAVVKADPEVGSQHIQPLYDALLVKPLKAASEPNQPGRVLTIVVDALDECGTVDTRKQLITCLLGLSRTVPWLRVVVTSRPDSDIQECFAQLGSDYTPYNVLGYDSLPDVSVFIRARLKKMEGADDWPEDAVERLSERSKGLFIWARTACEFIMRSHNRRRCLGKVLAGTHIGNPSAQLDELYTTAIRAGAGNEDEDDLADVLQCLGVVIATATRAPLSVPDLARLLRGRISQGTLDSVVQHLSSVLYVDQKRDNAVRVSHPSFTDYITDKSRSKELCVDLEEQNAMLAECCLETMTKELRFNMCGLETSHLLNQEVPGLDARVRDAIGGHLSYSCVYWTSHLVMAREQPLDDPLRAFLFEPQLLYWIEALSLLGKLGVALSSLLELSRTVDTSEDCQSYAHDVYRFVLSFYDPISESTPHLYVSAFPLAPENSKMVQRMRKYFPNTVAIIEGAEQEWTPCLRTISAESEIFAAVFSPNGRRIATGSLDGTVRVWDAETGATLLDPIPGHSSQVWSVAFSHDSRRIVSGSLDKTVRVWDAETGVALLGPLRGHSEWVRSVAFSPSGHRIVSGSEDNTVRIWDAKTGIELLQLRGHSDTVCSVVFSPNGHHIVSGSRDWTVRVWNAATGAALLEPLRGHSGQVLSAAFSPGGGRIVSGSDDKTVRIWDAETGAVLLQPLRGHSDEVLSVAFSPDSRLIFSGSSDNTVRIWDAETGTELVNPLLGHSSDVMSVAPSPDGRRLASGSGDMTLRIWDVEMRNVKSKSPQGHSGPVRSVAFSPNGHRIVSSSKDKTVRVWDAEAGDAVLEPLHGHSAEVYSVAFSPDGYRIVSGSEDKTLRLWDAKTGVGLLELHGHSDVVNSVAFSPDSHRVISGSNDETIRVWDAETGVTLLEPLQGHSGKVNSVALSPDGHRIASGSSDKTVRIWDAKTGAAVLEPLQHPNPVLSVAFSPDSHRIVSLSSGRYHWEWSLVRVWDAETGTVLLEWPEGGLGHMCSVVFSSDGRHIVSGSQKFAIQVSNAATGAPLLEPLRGHSDDFFYCIYSVAFSPDGRHIVSGSDDCTIRVWDTNTCARAGFQTRFLPGTRISVTSGCADSQLVSTSSLLTRHCKSNGWVTTSDGGLFLWLPLDLRTVDDSSICISAVPLRRRLVMDFAKFAHGSLWLSIADISL
ncbi:hypothetical protein FRC08_015492 [Ceratobasidium sp. 394]|nr:hypothetical protein FRC08_015492 [Ceratobasidium sp. 394]